MPVRPASAPRAPRAGRPPRLLRLPLALALALFVGPPPHALLAQEASGAATATPAPVAPPSPASAAPGEALELLDATLWTQLSAERAALCRQTFRAARAQLERALLDPTWRAAEEQPSDAAALPAAVIVDVDETVLDNVPFQARLLRSGSAFTLDAWTAWCRERGATPLPGAVEFCRRAQELGVTVFYVTNRGADVREDTRACLAGWGFPLRPGVETVLTREDTGDKGPRRAAIASGYRIVLLLGDAGGDFSSALGNGSAATRAAAFDARDVHWGRDWFVLPNPMYGAWESAFAPSAGQSRLDARLAALDPCGTLPDGTRTHAHGDDACAESAPATASGAIASARDEARRASGARASDDALPTHPLLDAGPMPSFSTTTSCGVWLRTKAPADVVLRCHPVDDPADARLSRPVHTSEEHDLTASVTFEGLRPGTTYVYEVYLDGRRATRPWPLTLRTQPAWRDRAPPPDVRVAVGSCAYVNDPPFDRPGKPYGGGYEIFERIADTSPDLMLWLGDNVYLRAGDWESEAGIRHRYAHTRELPELQRLLGTTAHLAIWDDHDYGPNDSDRSFPLAAAARRTFLDYWPDVTYPEGEGVYRRVERSDVEFFLLDDRTWRSPNEAPPTDDKRMLGERQMAWLLDALQSSRATFKVVANGGQMINPIVNFEGFGDFPAEQHALLAALDARRIDGVLFLSGDRHHSELLKLERDAGPPLYEFTCSPLTAGPVDRDLDPGNTARVEGTLVMQRNFGLIEAAGPPGARVLTLSIFSTDGDPLWTRAIPQDELRWE
ncbi:MAG: alkaline phosphatase D family protein [Planctomycetes bacterium]|nr:alkaline phosphatase D family protein [Planctomycetota bacterium]